MQEGKVGETFFSFALFLQTAKHPPKQPLYDLKYGDLYSGKDIEENCPWPQWKECFKTTDIA